MLRRLFRLLLSLVQRQLLQLRDRRVQLLDIFFHREGNRVNLLTRVVKRARPLRELRQPVQLLRRGVDGVTDARGSLVEHRFHLRRLVREMQRRASSFVVVVEIVVIQRRPELLLLLFLHVRGGGGGVKIRAFSFRRGAVLVVVFVSSPTATPVSTSVQLFAHSFRGREKLSRPIGTYTLGVFRRGRGGRGDAVLVWHSMHETHNLYYLLCFNRFIKKRIDSMKMDQFQLLL